MGSRSGSHILDTKDLIQPYGQPGIMQERPLQDSGYNLPGNYELNCYLSRSAVYDQDTVDLNVFITGYGYGEYPKIHMICSSQLFDTSYSYIINGVAYERGDMFKKDKFYFGSDTAKFPVDNSMTVSLGGVTNPKWKDPTVFIDANSGVGDHMIITEHALENPFLKLKLFTRNNLTPGDYTINLWLTYSNGIEWKSSNQVLPIHVNNFSEEHYILLTIILILSSLGVFSIGYEIFKNFRRKQHEKEDAINKSIKKIETIEPVSDNVKTVEHRIIPTKKPRFLKLLSTNIMGALLFFSKKATLGTSAGLAAMVNVRKRDVLLNCYLFFQRRCWYAGEVKQVEYQ